MQYFIIWFVIANAIAFRQRFYMRLSIHNFNENVSNLIIYDTFLW